MNHSAPFHDGSRDWQDKFATRALADREVALIFHQKVTADDKAFIESRDMFFLATADGQGKPTCSYKGGPVGFVKVVAEDTIAFPDYDGNGMFLSIGNISTNKEVGILFIDFENPQRLRLHGVASVHEKDPLLDEFAGAQLIVRIKITSMFINCPRYIHRYNKLSDSRFTPKNGEEAPVPEWKYLDEVQDVLPEKDKNQLASGKR